VRVWRTREDHLLPLMAVAGAAENDRGHVVSVDHVMKLTTASYAFGTGLT
jgi:hypothetical protein